MARAQAAKTKWGDREGRRKDILSAARRLLSRKGYAAFNLRDLAKDAGVTAGTVYTYFENKEDLFAILYAERLDRFHDEIAPLAGELGAEDLFVEVATRYLDVYRLFARELDVWAGLFDESKKTGEPVALAAQRVLATLAGAFGRFGFPQPELAMPLLWATLVGLCDQFTGPRRRLVAARWEEMTRFAAKTLVRGLAQKERSR